MYDAVLNKPLDLTPFDRFYKDGKLIKKFLSKCLDKSPTARPTVNELLDDVWIQTMVEDDVMEGTTSVQIGSRLD